MCHCRLVVGYDELDSDAVAGCPGVAFFGLQVGVAEAECIACAGCYGDAVHSAVDGDSANLEGVGDYCVALFGVGVAVSARPK